MVSPPAYAQDDVNARTEYELRAISNWAQSVTALNTRGVTLMQSSERINDSIDRFADGGLNERGLRREINAWRTQFDADIAQLRADFAALPPPPRLSVLASLQTGLEAVGRRSEQGIDQIAVFGRDMATLFEGVATGDIDSGAAMHQSAMRMLRELLEFENGSLAIMRAISPPEHPNQNIAGSRIAFNQAMIVVFDAYLTSIQAEAVTLSAAQRQQIRDAAVSMRQHNEAGRTVTSREQREMDLYGHTLSPSMRAGLTRMFASLQETFNTLDRGAMLLDNAAAMRDGAKVDDLDGLLTDVTSLAEELDLQNATRASALAGPTAPEL
jgi:hypothetical protein